MHRVIENINIVRLFSFTILMGVFLSAISNSEYLPAPIPIDFGVNNGMRSDSTICESCNISYDTDTMGAACCDEATQYNSDFTCEVLETTYLWNCSGCACAEDDDNWTTIFGCMDELACNYNSIAIWDDGSCSFTDGICQSCVEGEVVDNDDDGDSICNEDDNCPDTANADQTDTDSDGVGDACDYWTELNVEGGENQISLSWEPVESERPSFMNRDGCEDDPDICIWNSWYYDFDNQQDCEANGGIWGSYLEYFGTSCAEMVNDAGCNASILYWMVSDLCPESCEVCLDGCTDMNACNYNPDATDDDGSCVQPEYECFDGSIVCISSDCSGGEPVTYNVYRDGEILTGELMEPNYVDSDLGYSEFHCYTVTYNYGGDFEFEHSNEACAETNPEPVILGCTNEDACNYNAEATVDDGSCVLAEENYNCDGNCIAEIDECDVCGGDGPEIECWDGELVCNESDCSTGIDYTLTLGNHHNLVSFYALPDDASIGGITSSLGNNALSVITEGSSAINLDGIWSGSLTEITPENGYWISINNFPDNLSVIGFDMDPDRMYDLHEGPNLISFPDSGSADLNSAIPDDVEHLFTAIISEGVSALNSDYGWAGSLTGFQGGAGYWVIVQEDLSFSYNTEDLLARSAHSFSEKLPDEDGFIVVQSSRQAFYYVDDIKLDNGGVEDGDWILSYNNDVLAGIRQWKGNTVDIPNMGFAGDLVTAGYFNEGDVPTFKLLRQSTGKIITLEGNIPGWSENGIFILGELYEKQPIPELFVLNKAYPNPFNPTTTIGFGLPDQSEIVVEIYNLYGKRVETLVDKSMPAGYSSAVWNADKFSSGLYFVKLSAHSLKGIKYTNIQKLMLVK